MSVYQTAIYRGSMETHVHDTSLPGSGTDYCHETSRLSEPMDPQHALYISYNCDLKPMDQQNALNIAGYNCDLKPMDPQNTLNTVGYNCDLKANVLMATASH